MLIRHLVRFLRSPFKRQLLAVETLGSLAVAMFLVKYVPFRHWSAMMKNGVMQEPASFDEAPTPAAREVAHMIWRISRLFDNQFTCLMQAISAKWMLNRRRIPNTLVLGVRTEQDTNGRLQIKAHAWLQCASAILLGGAMRDPYTPIDHYHSTPGPPRRFPSIVDAKLALKRLLSKREQR
jgi:hypothetical protein